MLSPMNHREIEYIIKKFWKEKQIEEKNISNLFCEWENVTEREAAIKLMNWLEDMQKAVFQEDLLLDYGADCLRLYLMFEKTPEPDDTWLDTWEECNLEGCYKFLGRFRRMILVAQHANNLGKYQNLDVMALKNRVDILQTEVMQHLAKGNTMPNRHNAIAAIMEGMNELQKELGIGELVTKMHSHEIAMAVPHAQKQEQETNIPMQSRNGELDNILRTIILLIAPFAPVLAEHLWQRLKCDNTSVLRENWIKSDSKTEMIKLPVQVNARTKKVMTIHTNATKEEAEEKAKQELSQWLQGKEYQLIYVPGKILNFVIRR